MGISSDGMLIYGVDLGSKEEWPYEIEWFDDDTGDFIAQALDKLLATRGFTETWEDRKENYWQRRLKEEEALGVQIVTHCSYEYPMYIIGTKEYNASRGYPVEITPDDLVIKQEWDERIAWALSVLEITPVSDKPGWILTSVMG